MQIVVICKIIGHTEIEGVINMNSGGFAKGMAAGLLLGACAAVVIDPISDKQKRRLQKKTEGVFRNIGNIIDSAISILH